MYFGLHFVRETLECACLTPTTADTLFTDDFRAEPFTLPDPELGNIKEIETSIAQASKSPMGRTRVIEYILRHVRTSTFC
jgi:hypothetical protein